MIYGVSIDTVVSGIIIVSGAVMALPVFTGWVIMGIDIVTWIRERRKHK